MNSLATRSADGLATIADLWRPPNVRLFAAVRMWRRNATLFRRGWAKFVLPNFLEPVLYLVAIGIGIGLYVRSDILGVPYVEFIAPGLAASSAMYGAVFETTYNVYVKLRFHHVYDAIITTPLEPEDVALGELLWATTRSFMYGSAFLVVVFALGFVRSSAAPLAFLLLPLVGLSMGLIGFVFTALTPDIELFTYFFNLFIVPLFLFSGIFFPITDLPRWGQILAWFTPLHHGVEMARALVLLGDVTAALRHSLWLAVFCAIVLPPALNLFRGRLVD